MHINVVKQHTVFGHQISYQCGIRTEKKKLNNLHDMLTSSFVSTIKHTARPLAGF